MKKVLDFLQNYYEEGTSYNLCTHRGDLFRIKKKGVEGLPRGSYPFFVPVGTPPRSTPRIPNVHRCTPAIATTTTTSVTNERCRKRFWVLRFFLRTCACVVVWVCVFDSTSICGWQFAPFDVCICMCFVYTSKYDIYFVWICCAHHQPG